MGASRILIALGVILVGVCAAWPFRQAQQPVGEAPSATVPLKLTLRRPDAPLELAPRIEVSPAVGLEGAGGRGEGRGARGGRTEDGSQDVVDLGNMAPPPALPVSFQPSVGSSLPNDWRPEPVRGVRVQGSGFSQGQSRPYRLRDGDTLEGIAERLLGNRGRAVEIFEVNRGVLARPDLLPVGVTIVLPARESGDELEPVGGVR